MCLLHACAKDRSLCRLELRDSPFLLLKITEAYEPIATPLGVKAAALGAASPKPFDDILPILHPISWTVVDSGRLRVEKGSGGSPCLDWIPAR